MVMVMAVTAMLVVVVVVPGGCEGVKSRGRGW